MKKWLLIASCLALNLPALASAQPEQGHDRQGDQVPGARPAPGSKPAPGGRPGQGGPGQGGPGQSGPGQGGPGNAGPNRPVTGGPGHGGGGRPGMGGPSQPGNGPNRPNPGPNRPNPTPNRPTPGPNRPNPGPGRPGIRPPNPPRPSRPNWGWNGRRFRLGVYRYPAGWHYRRWGIGQFLPMLFLSPLYYFNDWAMMGIAPPPFGYRWVRFGPDLLLVQIGSGYIATVIYNVFY